MKKMLVSVLAIVLFFGITGCGKDGKSVVPPPTPPPTDTPPPPPDTPPQEPARWTLPEGAENISIAANPATGELYVFGETKTGLSGFVHAGGLYDVFFAKFNADGTVARMTQWGSAGSDFAIGLKFFGGHAYFLWEQFGADGTSKIAVSKYGAHMNALETGEPLLLGFLYSFAVDAGGIYFPYSAGSFPMVEIGVVKLNHALVEEGVFSSTVPGYYPAPQDIYAHGGNIYLTGFGRVGVSEPLDPRFASVFTAKLDGLRNFVWGDAWSSDQGVDEGLSIIVANSAVYTAGYWGQDTNTAASARCLFLKHSLEGTLLRTHQDARVGTFLHSASDDAGAVYAMDGAGGGCGLTKFNADGTVAWETAHTGTDLALIGKTLFITDKNNVKRIDTATGNPLQ